MFKDISFPFGSIGRVILAVTAFSLLPTNAMAAEFPAPKSETEMAKIFEDPKVAAVINEATKKAYLRNVERAFKAMADLSQKNSDALAYFQSIFGQESLLKPSDWNYLKNVTKGQGTLTIVRRKDGLLFSFAGQRLNLKVTAKLGEVTEDGRPVLPLDFSRGLETLVREQSSQAQVESPFEMQAPHRRSVSTLVSNAVLPRAEAVLPLGVWAVWMLAKHAVMGAVVGAAVGGTIQAVTGCGLGLHSGETSKTYWERCKEGVGDYDLATPGAGVGAALVGGVFGTASIWNGEDLTNFQSASRNPAEIAKLRKFIKLGGVLAVLTPIYHGGKHLAEGYGVEIECLSRDVGGWVLRSVRGGKTESVIGCSEDSLCLRGDLAPSKAQQQAGLTKFYESYLQSKGVPREALSALAKKLEDEHKERTEFCSKNPGKTERAIFSAHKDAAKSASGSSKPAKGQPTAK